jgi:hypothetical protein
LGTAIRFNPPTVANSKLYVGTDRAVVVYGLGRSPCAAIAPAIQQLLDSDPP